MAAGYTSVVAFAPNFGIGFRDSGASGPLSACCDVASCFPKASVDGQSGGRGSVGRFPVRLFNAVLPSEDVNEATPGEQPIVCSRGVNYSSLLTAGCRARRSDRTANTGSAVNYTKK